MSSSCGVTAVRLGLLFILVPAAELALLLEIGQHLGILPTLALILVTGTAGAALARHQGLAVLRRIREQMSLGQLPGDALLDGVIVLVAAALLITPGVLTDTVGLLCLLPPVRAMIKRALYRRLQRFLQRRGTVVITHHVDL